MRWWFVASLGLVVAGGAAAMGLGVPPSLLPTLATLWGFAVVLPLQRLRPRIGRAPEAGERQADAAWFAASAVGDAAAGALLTGLAAWLAPPLGQGLAGLWLGPAVAAVLLLRSFGDYWAHRLAHELPWLWRMHAVHHAPRRMVATNNPRLHPGDLVLKRALQLGPALWLGLPAEAIALVGAVAGLQVAFQHADVDVRYGVLDLAFATNHVHRWHHSADPAEANANYGNILVLWDHLFGTYRVPDADEDPAAMGLFDGLVYPVHQPIRALMAPLCWRRCTRGAATHGP